MATKKASKKPAKKAAAAEQIRFKILPVSRLGDGPHRSALSKAIKLVPSNLLFAKALGIKPQSLNRAWGLGRVPEAAILKLAAIAGVTPNSLDRVLYPNKDWSIAPIVVTEPGRKKKPVDTAVEKPKRVRKPKAAAAEVADA